MRKEDVILQLVSKYYGLSPSVILSKKRTREIVMAKQMCAFLLREHCSMTFVKIANYMTNASHHYDHSCVIYGCRKMKEALLCKEMPSYGIYKAILQELREDGTLSVNVNPKLIIRYPKGFNIQEVIQHINSRFKTLEYELV